MGNKKDLKIQITDLDSKAVPQFSSLVSLHKNRCSNLCLRFWTVAQ